jgi:peptidoglycan DL-endopeptidase CwlO
MRAPLVLRAFALSLGLAGLAGCANEATLPPGALVTPGRQDAPPSAASNAVVAFAEAQIGRPYCWGGAGPRCFDCSGLTMVAWKQVGVRLPRTADAIAQTLPEVRLDDVRPGDILWWPGHVGIYAGNGWSVEALNARSGVVMRRAASPRRVFRPVGVM